MKPILAPYAPDPTPKVLRPQSSYDPLAVDKARTAMATQRASNERVAQQQMAVGGRGPASLYEPAGPDPADQDAAAQLTLDKALRAQRVEALGAPLIDKNPGGIRDKIDQLTKSEYDALNPTQQDAVDFNTMLVRTVRRDLRQQDTYKPNADEQAAYAGAITEMFPTGGGSTLYAPETVALLKQLDFRDTAASLNDFLGLQAAITADDLAAMLPTRGHQAEMRGPEGDRRALSLDLAQSTDALATALAKGNSLLQSIPATAVSARNSAVDILGGNPKEPATMTGFGQPASGDGQRTTDGYFQAMFDALANKGGKPPEKLITEGSAAFGPDLWKQFLAYAANRSTNALQYGLALGQTEGVDYRTPEELRALLGVEEPANG